MGKVKIAGQIYNIQGRVANNDAAWGPWASIDEAVAKLTELGQVVVGKTVGIKQTNGSILEYWVQPTSTGVGLVEKGAQTGASGTVYTKGETNTLLAEKLPALVSNIRGVFAKTADASDLQDELEESYEAGDTTVNGSQILIIDPEVATSGDSMKVITFDEDEDGYWKSEVVAMNIRPVTITPTYTASDGGDQIATFTFNGVQYNLYAPPTNVVGAISLDTSFDSNPQNTRVPSTKLVKDQLDLKADKTQVTQLSTKVGDLSNLNTDDVSSLVNAINEVLSKIGSGGSGSGSSSGGGSVQVVNNLSSTSTTAALSANMGKSLNDAISALQNLIGTNEQLQISNATDIVDAINKVKALVDALAPADNLTSDSTTKPLSAKQGKALKALIDDISGKLGDLGDMPVADAIGAINDTIGDAESMVQAHGSIVGAIDSVEGRVASLEQNGGGSSSGGGSASGTTNYNDLTNKPSINGHEVSGDMTYQDLGIIPTIQIIANGTSASSDDVVSEQGDSTTGEWQSLNGTDRMTLEEGGGTTASTRVLLKNDGTTQSGASLEKAHVCHYNINGYSSVKLSGYSPSTSENAFAAFIAEDGTTLVGSTMRPVTTGGGVTNRVYSVPDGAYYVLVFGISTSVANCKVYVENSSSGDSPSTSTINININDILDALNNKLGQVSKVSGKCITASDGTLADSSVDGAHVTTFSVSELNRYKVSGFSPSASSGNAFVAFFTASGIFLESYTPINNKVVSSIVVKAPTSATTMKVYGTESSSATAYKYSEYSVNPIVNVGNIYPQQQSHRLKVLCFGSSWFMCTWFYLSKICAGAGIDCDFTCFYLGAAAFDEWVSLYNGTLPTWASTRSGQICTSSDGAAWSRQTISVNTNDITKEEYMAAFQNAMKAGDWDIIAFQQGAKQATTWSYWKNYNDLIRIVKMNCKPTTKIAFNSTWTPSVTNSTSYMCGFNSSLQGQQGFQTANWENTKRFMSESGISEVSPCGALLYSIRRDSTLNNSKDLCTDLLHPDNGMPIFALGLCFFETFIAPIYGKSIDDVTTLPTTSWQKALVAGSSYVSMDSTKLARVKKHVRLALANRFGFNTLED